ncbi:hypothetical protein GJ654_08455 [Rhodoblastus acidophilus]|uniref:Uncharacterized protein n=1 Tax=Rhodoblastus acidophilus TaxID=1074 RepID=A0A6N8DN95_RHOAC|nr:hypothetical protein [Rhodoblastus acidophilus]MCW2273829.1 hypothetical protein [Rhodoblastus acidophilus]MTV31025.1 hypothetical protein [Rhodoblastus acidophilus]
MSPSTEIPQGFVNALWAHLDAAIQPWVEKRLRSFAKRHGVLKWIISTDFCIRDQHRPNDSFAFVILPADEKFEETQDLLRGLPSRDLKDVKRIPAEIKDALRRGRAFTFCFVADRDRRLYVDVEAARRSLDDTIAMAEHWANAGRCGETIAKLRAMRAEASKANLNLRLLEDLTVTAALAAHIVTLICRLGPVERVGWVADRDRITECYSGIAATLFAINVAGCCHNLGLPEPKLGIFTQTSEDLWCDPFIRLADYVAGVAAWDPPVTNRVQPKIAELVRDVFADNRHLFLFHLAFYVPDGRPVIEVRRVAISTKPLPRKQRKSSNASSLRGRSRDLKTRNAN